jgi:hypothetical protein
LRFITGRHDLPFHFHDEVEVQKSFLDTFLKEKDTVGWSIPGEVSSVSMVLRKGNEEFNNPKPKRCMNAEKSQLGRFQEHNTSSTI